MNRISFCITILIIGVLQSLADAAVKAWEGALVLPTYTWVEDINPKFFALENSIIYPYTMQDQLTNEREDRVYQALFLENEYLKVTCLPELAGRIFSVLDKTTGEEMFHKNPVVKPGMIAMRGAWISGGIEWNTGPHGHSATIVSPVNAAIRENPDGSATLVISNTEQIFRTRWSVFLTLHPGKAYLDEFIRIVNPTDFVHPYYFWNCTAFVCGPGTRFIYPMTLGSDHNGTSFFSWPVHEGKDLTWLKNYDSPTSVFAYECIFDFFGAYDTELDRGIVQYANHHEVIGKKAWTWGQSGDGIVSQRNLHEGDEQYIEVQSGPLLTQADYGLLPPHRAVEWREWWYPVHGLGDGFEYANLNLAAQRRKVNGKLEFRFLPTENFKRGLIRIEKENEIVEETVELSPEAPVVFSTPFTTDASVNVTVLDAKGIVLLSYQSPLPVPKQTAPEPGWQAAKPEKELSAEELYFKALTLDKQTDRPASREGYRKALEKDPGHTASRIALAVLDLEAGLDKDAAAHLEKVVERNPDEGKAWYFLAVAYLQTNRMDKAMTCAYKAVRALSAEPLGYDLTGRILMRRGEYAEALAAFEKSLQRHPRDERTQDHRLLALYALGQDKEARALAQQYTKHDRTYPLPAMVMALLDKRAYQGLEHNLNKHLGEDEFEWLESYFVFLDLGLREDAYWILHALLPESPESALSPMPYYCMAALTGDKEEAAECLRKAESMTADRYFPSRLEEIGVLDTALEQSKSLGLSAARTHLRLGNLLAGLGRLDEARAHWQKAAESDTALNVAWRNMGMLAWKKDNDLKEAARCYLLAIEANREDQTLYRDLAQILLQNNKRGEAIALIETLPKDKNRRTDLIEILAQAYADEKQYDKTIALLNDSFFSNWENRTVSRNLFARAYIERGKQRLDAGDFEDAMDDFSTALTYPDHLGVGRPAHPAEAEPYYWQGMALQAMGREQDALESWKRGADSRPAEFRNKCREKLPKSDQ